MTRSSFRRRLATWIGVSAAALLTVTGVVAGIGAGVASADVVSPITLPTGIQPAIIAQNTAASETITLTGPPFNLATANTGRASGWTFQLSDNWRVGQTLSISVKTSSGANCETKSPQGVNQHVADPTNYVGFPDYAAGHTIAPIIFSNSSGETNPTFNVTESTPLSSLGCTGADSFQTLNLTTTNAGDDNGSVLTVGIGYSLGVSINVGGTSYDAALAAPVTYNVGYGTTPGPVDVSAGGSIGGVGAIDSNATIVGETPSANVPPSGVSRGNSDNTPADFTVPPTGISQFTISESKIAALPPVPVTGGGAPAIVTPSSAPGAVCLEIDNRDGNNNYFPSTPGWSVTPNAGTAGNSAAAGAASVENDASILQLPVTASSNTGGTVWTTSGLSIAGYSPVDGPIWATAYWVQGPVNAQSCQDASAAQAATYELGYVQLTTVTQAAPSIFGADTDATAAAALEHQFDYANGECIGSIYPGFLNGPSLFLATDENYPDALAASYAAGTVDSGTLLTPTNSLDPQTLDAIRLEGAQTIYVAGGPLAVSDAVVSQLESTPSYLCGGTQPRVDLGTGQPENLNVIRIYGQTQYDTAQQLGEFVGAEPLGQMTIHAWGTGDFNTTTGSSSPSGPASPTNTAILATGTNFDDAVAASAPAYADQFPIFLTDGSSLSPQALNGIFNDHIGQVILVGGPLAVSDNVVSQLEAAGIAVLRVAGQDATDTSAQLASFELAKNVGLGWDNSDHEWDNFVARTSGATGTDTGNLVDGHVALLVRGDFYADALVSGELTVHNGLFKHNQALKPILLTENPSTLGPYIAVFLNEAGLAVSDLTGAVPAGGADVPIGYNHNEESSSVFTIQPVGGPVALNPSTIAAAQNAISTGFG